MTEGTPHPAAPPPAGSSGARIWRWLPLLAFVIIALLAAWAMFHPEDHEHRSALIDKPLPAFSLPAAIPGGRGVVSSGVVSGGTAGGAVHGPRLINIFASWCIPCAEEAPSLMTLSRQGVVIEGIAIRDDSRDLKEFLQQHGNPYAAIGLDPEARVQLALGSSGVPESFIVDARGIIRYQHIGPIMPQDQATILSAIKAAQ